MMSRRTLLRAGAAALPLAVGSEFREAVGAPDRLPSLKDAAARAGLGYGSDSDVDFSRAPAEYEELFLKQCGLYAGLFLWSDKCRNNGLDCPPAWADPNVKVVLDHGLKLSGGHLMYHQTTPAWFARLDSAKAAEAAMVRHIDDLAGRYKGHVYSWNVFNEALNPHEGHPLGLRHTPELRLMGPEEFDVAFHAARAADPQAL